MRRCIAPSVRHRRRPPALFALLVTGAAAQSLVERIFVSVEIEHEALSPCERGDCRAAGLVAAQCASFATQLTTAFFGDRAEETLPVVTFVVVESPTIRGATRR